MMGCNYNLCPTQTSQVLENKDWTGISAGNDLVILLLESENATLSSDRKYIISKNCSLANNLNNLAYKNSVINISILVNGENGNSPGSHAQTYIFMSFNPGVNLAPIEGEIAVVPGVKYCMNAGVLTPN
jgi:hypothetical protein